MWISRILHSKQKIEEVLLYLNGFDQDQRVVLLNFVCTFLS